MQTAEPSEGPYTWDDFVALEEDDLRELVDGHLVEIEVPGAPHERIVVRLSRPLDAWAEQHGGVVLASGYKVRVSDRRGVMPDVQYHRSSGRLPEKALDDGRPDLAIEIVSPSSQRYDRITKLSWYASIGVPEYWIVDPRERSLERLVLRDGSYSIREQLVDDAVFEPDSFPGLSIPLSRLWE